MAFAVGGRNLPQHGEEAVVPRLVAAEFLGLPEAEYITGKEVEGDQLAAVVKDQDGDFRALENVVDVLICLIEVVEQQDLFIIEISKS